MTISEPLAIIQDAVDSLPSGTKRQRATSYLRQVADYERQSGSITELLDLVEANTPRAGAEGRLTVRERAALHAVGADSTPLRPSQRASTRTALRYLELIKGGLSTAQAADLLGVSDGRIRQRIGEGSLLAVRAARGHSLPRFQFTEAGELPGWAQVAPHVSPRLPMIAVATFMTTPSPDLSGDGQAQTPQQWLMQGGAPDRVARLISE